ncbi:DUF4296 domain-containing protein [Schleiferiaceae bacterium]|nr:DUF4296 domain-containing protein [Schleiferiaceae bacterium]MDA8564569.1 DUF4296 domain-containing protein [Schleiferiaceae bacterium]MDA9192113.1 DUF4296 domain-containing protein [Schleiferiaceae bacterium]MDA9199292.1 DUF4296 domain-containing protein [Schleiferiaceae bacterium]
MMRLGHYFASVLFILFIGCASPEVQTPETVLTPEQMMPIMVDIHVIEGARNGAIMLGDTNGIEDYYAKVYEKHGITEDQFKSSFAFYSDNPTVFIPIYEEVLDSLKANGALLAKKGVKIEYED